MKNISIFIAGCFFLVSAAQAKTPSRKITSARSACYANVGLIGYDKDVTKDFPADPNREYDDLKRCTQLSTSSEEISHPTRVNIMGKTETMESRVKMSSVPFVFSQGEFEYHLLNGQIIGVTRIR